MRILQVISSFPPAYAYGGALKVAYGVSKELVNRGHEVTVFTTDAFDSNSRLRMIGDTTQVDGITVRRFKNLSNYMAWNWNLPIAPGMALALRDQLNKFDIIHIHEYISMQAEYVHHYARECGVPYVLQAHGSIGPSTQRGVPKHLFDRLFGLAIIRDASGFVAVTKTEVRQYQEMGMDDKRIWIVPNALDCVPLIPSIDRMAFKRMIGIRDQTKVVLYLGRLHERKGIDILIHSFAELVEGSKNTVLVIAGPGDDYKKKLMRLVDELELTDKVKFIGFVENVADVYHAADVLVYPAINEIFGLVPFEAILYGTPIIVSDDSGCGEIVREADCGLLVNYGDVAGLKEKITQVLTDPLGAETRTRKGKEYITCNLSWGRVVDKLERAYAECLNHACGQGQRILSHFDGDKTIKRTD